MPVSLFGQCADYDSINKIADSYNLPVIEDAAQSFGAEYKDKKSCALTTIGCTSFFPSKPLGCYGDGGACFTNNEDLYERIKALRVHGATSKNTFDLVGVNGRLDTLQAAILLVKMEIFNTEIRLRQKVAEIYDQLIKNAQTKHKIQDINAPVINSFNKSVFAQYTLKVRDREKVIKNLEKDNIPYAIHYSKLVNEHSAYATNDDLAVAKSLTEKVISIPMHPYLEKDQQETIIESIFKP